MILLKLTKNPSVPFLVGMQGAKCMLSFVMVLILFEVLEVNCTTCHYKFFSHFNLMRRQVNVFIMTTAHVLLFQLISLDIWLNLLIKYSQIKLFMP